MLANLQTLLTAMELYADPDYDDGKSWWSRNWRAVVRLVLFAVAVAIIEVASFIPGGQGIASAAISVGIKAAVSGYVIGGLVSGIVSAVQGNSFINGAIMGAAQGALNGFSIAVITFGIGSAIKAVIVKVGAANAKYPVNFDTDEMRAWAKAYKKSFEKEGGRISVVSSAFDDATGMSYYGVNRGYFLSGEKLNPQLAKLMPGVSLNDYPLGNCAEFQAINRALNAGAKLKNLHVYTMKITTKMPFIACENCTFMFNGKVAGILTGITG